MIDTKSRVEHNFKSDVISAKNSVKTEYRLQIVWRNVFGMSVLHMAGLYGFYLGCAGVGDLKNYLVIWFLNFMGGFSILAGKFR